MALIHQLFCGLNLWKCFHASLGTRAIHRNRALRARWSTAPVDVITLVIAVTHNVNKERLTDADGPPILESMLQCRQSEAIMRTHKKGSVFPAGCSDGAGGGRHIEPGGSATHASRSGETRERYVQWRERACRQFRAGIAMTDMVRPECRHPHRHAARAADRDCATNHGMDRIRKSGQRRHRVGSTDGTGAEAVETFDPGTTEISRIVEQESLKAAGRQAHPS